MEPFQAVILGIIQGLTEFLPVSSSGHLVILQSIFKIEEPALIFDISVHLGTLTAVIIYFRKQIQAIIVATAKFIVLFSRRKVSFNQIYDDFDTKMAFLIIVGSVPTAIIGLLFHKIAERLFASIIIAGFMLLITGSFLWATRWIKGSGKNIEHFSIKTALVIGVVQGIAILPGISRSGSTIVAGLFSGLDRKTAAVYSFLLSVPAIFGASILSLKDFGEAAFSGEIMLLGALTSCIVGYLALKWLVYIVTKGRMHLFAPYCWTVGVIALILGYFY